jgi:hypothetical protein
LLLCDELGEISGEDDSLYMLVYEPAGDADGVGFVDTVGLNPDDADAEILSMLDTLACCVAELNTDVVPFALDDTTGVVDSDGIFDTLTEGEGVCDSVANGLFDTDDDTEDVDDCVSAADADSVANPVFVDETLGEPDNVKCPLFDNV